MRQTHRHQRPSAATPRRGRLAALVGLVLAAALLASCSTVRTITDLTDDLQSAGFRDVRVTVEGGDPFILVVSADAPSGATTAEGHDEAAELVWTRFPRRIERLRVTIDGDRRGYTADELEEEHGPRPEGLDDGGDLTDEWTRVALGTVVAVLVGGLLLVLLLGVGVLLVVRRRRSTARSIGGPPAPWAPHRGVTGGPAPVPPPGGWQPPAPDAGPPGSPGPLGETHPPPVAPPDGPSALPGPPSPASHEHDRLPPQPPVGPPPSPEHTAAAAAAAVDRRDRGDPRRVGRRPRGPRPPADHLPPGWD